MAIYDMIEVIQGSLGSGKSLVAVSECINQLKRGGVVATNFEFDPLWAYNLSGVDARVALGIRDRYDYSCDLHRRAYKIGNPESMMELSGDEGRNLAELCTGRMKKEILSGGRGHRAEGKGLLILDDCHHFFNSRGFQKNSDYVAFFANARKWGWRTILITHSIENIDKQIRSYVEIESRFRNLKKVNIPYTPFPMSPFNCFIIVRRYAGLGPGSGQVHSKDFYPMDKVAANMYNTLERFSADKVLGKYELQGWHPSKYTVKGSPSSFRDKLLSVFRRSTPLPPVRKISLLGQASVYPRYHLTIKP